MTTRKPRKPTPTARTISLLQSVGWCTWVTEHWLRFPGRKAFARHKDLLGFIDLIGLRPPEIGVVGVQACIVGDMTTRLKKILKLPLAHAWLRCSNRIWIIGWKEYVIRRGCPLKKWNYRWREVALGDFKGAGVERPAVRGVRSTDGLGKDRRWKEDSPGS